MTALAVVLLWAAYLVRDVLLLIYMSGLLAVGFSPIVRLIERQRFLPIGTRRFPRWLAILVLYLFIIGVLVGIGFLVVPPLVASGAAAVGRAAGDVRPGAGVPGRERAARAAADDEGGGGAGAGEQGRRRRRTRCSAPSPASSAACSASSRS